MADNTDILKGLLGILDHNLIKTDPDTLSQYNLDRVQPKAVLFPTSTVQVSETVRYANREGLAIVPWGSGTKMAMGTPPDRMDLVLCTSRLNRMKDVDSANLTITVEAGVKFRDIQARLATEEDRCYLPIGDLSTGEDEMICSDRSHSGCFLPIDPPWSKRATIGGIVACNSCGPRRLLYGLPRDILLGVRFVAPDGTIVGTGGKTVKNVSGYDISKLMIGSMGTLGILCDMTFRLLPLPERMETFLASFGSFSDASAFAKGIFETKLLPAAVEVMNDAAMENTRRGTTYDFEPGDFFVAIALEAFDEAVSRMRSDLVDMATHFGARSSTTIPEDEHLRFWLSLSDLEETVAGRYPGLISAKLNYPLSKWDSIIRFSDEILSSRDIPHTVVAHAGSGVSVINLLREEKELSEVNGTLQAFEIILKNCRDGGGNMIIQAAPSELKGHLPVWGEPGQDLLVMKRIREQLDPSGVMSPGRFVGGL